MLTDYNEAAPNVLFQKVVLGLNPEGRLRVSQENRVGMRPSKGCRPAA